MADLVEADELLNRLTEIPIDRRRQIRIRTMLSGVIKKLQQG